jgi:ribosomal protein L13E
MKRDWDRDSQGNFVNSPQHRGASRFPMPSEISGLYPRAMNQEYKLQASRPGQGMTIEELRKYDGQPHGNRVAGQMTQKKK